MYTKWLFAFVLALFLVFFYGSPVGRMAIAEESIPANLPHDSCGGKYIRGITLEMIDRWLTQTQTYATVRFQHHTPILYDVNGVTQEVDFQAEGGALVTGRGIVSVSHMTETPSEDKVRAFLMQKLEKGQTLSKIQILVERQWFQLVYQNLTVGGRDNIQLKTVDPYYHLAFFELKGDLPDPYPFIVPLGHSEKLSVGTSVFIGGNPLQLGTSFRSGEVSSLVKRGKILIQLTEPPLPNSFYLINLSIIWGDSGHVIYAMTPCGDAEVVGMAFVFSPGLGLTDLRWVIDVDILRLFLKKNGVDLDMLQKKYKAWRSAQQSDKDKIS